MRVAAAALSFVLSSAAFAQALPAQPVNLRGRNCWGGADARAQGTVLNGNITGGGDLDGALPSGSTTAASSAQGPLSGGSLGGGGGGEALVAIAVAAAVALPVIVYAIDNDADDETLFQHTCPRFDFAFTGGAVNTPTAPEQWTPLVGAALRFTGGAFGFDASLESTLDTRAYGSADAHFLLRPPPKQHIEGALALGVRRVVFGGAERNGFEVGLPHRYVLSRWGRRPLGLSLTPAVFVGDHGFDYRLEGGLTFPVGFTSLDVGARVFSFDEHVRFGMYLAMAAGN